MPLINKTYLKWLALIPCLIISGCLGASIAAFREPSVGAINNQLVGATAKLPTWKLLEGKAFTLEYLSNYVSKDSHVSTPDHLLFVTEGLVSKKLAIAVDSLRGHPLDAEPAFQDRKLHPDIYRLDTRKLAGTQFPVMIRLDNTEQVAFLVRGNTLATIALTNGDSKDMPVDEFNHMLESWKWK